jgi:hypothetical protein
MKWNKQGAKWQNTRRGTTRAHEYYFITTYGTGANNKWAVGFYGFGKQIVMNSAGLFDTAQEARAYCEARDREAVIIEEVRA